MTCCGYVLYPHTTSGEVCTSAVPSAAIRHQPYGHGHPCPLAGQPELSDEWHDWQRLLEACVWPCRRILWKRRVVSSRTEGGCSSTYSQPHPPDICNLKMITLYLTPLLDKLTSCIATLKTLPGKQWEWILWQDIHNYCCLTWYTSYQLSWQHTSTTAWEDIASIHVGYPFHHTWATVPRFLVTQVSYTWNSHYSYLVGYHIF